MLLARSMESILSILVSEKHQKNFVSKKFKAFINGAICLSIKLVRERERVDDGFFWDTFIQILFAGSKARGGARWSKVMFRLRL